MNKLIVGAVCAFFMQAGSALAGTIGITLSSGDDTPINIGAYLDLVYQVHYEAGETVFKFSNVIIDWGDGTFPIEDPWVPDSAHDGTHYTFGHLYAAEGDFTISAIVLGTILRGGLPCLDDDPLCHLKGTAEWAIHVSPAVETAPIPSALLLFASALGGLGFVGLRKRKGQKAFV